MIKVLKYPDPLLLKKTQPVTDFTEAAQIITELKQATRECAWGTPVGFAANQIGHDKSIFITQYEEYINPEVIWMPKEGLRDYEEGCYSLEDQKYTYRVKRPYAVRLKWQDLQGYWHEDRYNGFSAEVILHEYDHLQGILCNSSGIIVD